MSIKDLILPAKLLDALDWIEDKTNWCQKKLGLSDYHFKWLMWVDGFIVATLLFLIF